MTTTIAVANQKGGVGKSTTAEALTAGLSLRGHKVLGIDLDAQANFTYTAGARADGATTLGVLTGEVKIADAIQHTECADIVPANKALSGADAFITDTGKEYRLKEALDAVKGEYDYIVIDTPPALGILTINAITACNSVIIPAQADVYSIQGIMQLDKTIRVVKKYCNPSLAVAGILLTRYNANTVLGRDAAELADKLATELGTKVFTTRIREAVAVREAQILQKTIFEHAPGAKVVKDYKAFIEELLTQL